MPETGKKQMVSPQEAADRLGVDRDTIFRLIKRGRLPASKLTSRIIRIPVAAIEAFVAESAL